MTEQELVEALRACTKSDAPGCRSCPLFTLPSYFDGGKSCVDMLLEHAADAIEALAANRDVWKHRCESAERELNRIADCESCENWKRSSLTDACLCCYKSGFVEGERNYTWRGPCKENGGTGNAHSVGMDNR